MKIQIVSDLHLEFEDVIIPNNNNADVLVLSGDICIAQDLHDHPAVGINSLVPLGNRQRVAIRCREFFSRVSSNFKHVIYVMGNHEHYHGKIDRSYEYLTAELAPFSNIHLLDNHLVEIEGVHFVGGTLWTDMNKGDSLTLYHMSQMMNDFKVIRIAGKNYSRFSPNHAISEHLKTKNYIKIVLDTLPEDATVVVVGHHAPSFQSISERYQKDTIMNGGYASDLSEFILDNPKIKLWTHGHMHQNYDYLIGTTRVVCNPKGYHEENKNEFDPNFTVEL